MKEFIVENYGIIIGVAAFIIFALIGYAVDTTKKTKQSIPPVEKPIATEEEAVKQEEKNEPQEKETKEVKEEKTKEEEKPKEEKTKEEEKPKEEKTKEEKPKEKNKLFGKKDKAKEAQEQKAQLVIPEADNEN